MDNAEIKRARWKTTFGAWIRNFGVIELAKKLRINQHNIYQWIYATSTPRLDELDELLQLSNGKLTVKDIAEHKNIVLSLKSKAVAA